MPDLLEGPAAERRRHPRTGITLPGRYLTSDGVERECVTVDVSPGGARLRTHGLPAMGSSVIAYIRDLGRIEGMVVRLLDDGFALALKATPAKGERLRNHIDRLLRKDDPGLAERRLLPRVEFDGACVQLIDAEGRRQTVELIDVSATGVAFRCEMELRLDDALIIGAQSARVTRLFEGGAAARFV